VSEPDKGQADAINKGIKKATGDIVAFINSDDYYFSGAFNKIADLFMKNPKIKWVTGSYKIVDQDNHPIQPLVVSYKKIIRKFSGPRVLRFANYIVQPSTFWRRSVHEEIGYFDDSLRYTFDYDFWLRLMDLCPPFVIDYPISVFRIHAKSKGGKEYMAQFAEELNVLKKYRCNWVEFQFHKLHNKMITNLYKVLK
jgi:glycosyltransferase involved in cell wall biosynthesis